MYHDSVTYRLEIVTEVRDCNAVLLVAGDKAGQWTTWYQQSIPLAEARYAIYLKEKEE